MSAAPPPFGIACEELGCDRWAPMWAHPSRGGFYREEVLLPSPGNDGWRSTDTGWLCPDHA